MTSLQFALGVAVLFAALFAAGWLVAAISRGRDDRSPPAGGWSNPRRSWLLLVLFAAVALRLPGGSADQFDACLPGAVPSPVAAVIHGVVGGAVAVASLAAIRRGLATGGVPAVDTADLASDRTIRLRWWAAHLLGATGLLAPFTLWLRASEPLGLLAVALALPIAYVVLVALWPPSVRADRLREPTDDERERVAAAVPESEDFPDGIVVRSGGAPAPTVSIPCGEATCYLDESVLALPTERALGVALVAGLARTRSRFGLLERVRQLFRLEGTLLLVATVAAATVIDPSGSIERTVVDPITLGLAATGAVATTNVAGRATRSTFYRADRVAADRFGADVVRTVLEAHPRSLAVVRPGGDGGSRNAYHRLTVGQRTTALERFTGGRAPSERSAATRRTASALLGWVALGAAAAVFHVGLPAVPVDPTSDGGAAAAITSGVLVGVVALGGYALLTSGVPLTWLPMAPEEIPVDPSHVHGEWSGVAVSGAGLAVAFALVAQGIVHWSLLLLAVPWLWGVRRLSALRPMHVPLARVRYPTAAERRSVEDACASVDREPGTIAVFEDDREWGDVFVTRSRGRSVAWIDASLPASADDGDLETALAQADERGRRFWSRRGLVAVLAIALSGLFGIVAVFAHPSASVRGWILVYVLLALPIVAVLSVLARRAVVRADSAVASTIGHDTLRSAYRRLGDRIGQVPAPSHVVGRELGRVVALLSPEPSMDARIERLDGADADEGE